MIRKITCTDAAAFPGMARADDREFCYIQSGNLSSFHRAFEKVGALGDVPLPASGGIVEGNAIIRTPDGRLFFALSYKGDIEGWRTNVRACCKALGLSWGTLEAGRLMLETGEFVDLATCKLETYQY